MSKVVLSVNGVKKKFCRSLKRSYLYGLFDVVSDLLFRRVSKNLRKSEFWALNGVSFELREGESIGLVGANGSGKTTLLKIISGISPLTDGTVSVSGSIAPLLALGAGFKPVLSGRENIRLNLRLLGLSSQEIEDKFNEVVEFSELNEALDAPLYTYSSGMSARLGFACAVATNAKILIVDEVLAVGDAKFRAKCRNKINELRKKGVSLLIVSHNPISIMTLADRCIYLKKGNVIADGEPLDILKLYEAESLSEGGSNESKVEKNVQAVGFESIEFFGGSAQELAQSTKPATILFKLKSDRVVKDVSINIIVSSIKPTAQNVLFLQSVSQVGWLELDEGRSTIALDFPTLNVKPGRYKFKINVSTGPQYDILDVVDELYWDVKDPGGFGLSEFYQAHKWDLQGSVVAQSLNANTSETFAFVDID